MDLNIRKVERESVQELKATALTLGMTLRELCIKKLGIEAERLEVKSGHKDDDAGRGGSGETGAAKRKRNPAGVPVLRKAESAAVGLHPVQSVRRELAGRGEHRQEPVDRAEAEVHGVDNLEGCRAKGHRILNSGGNLWCFTCKPAGGGQL